MRTVTRAGILVPALLTVLVTSSGWAQAKVDAQVVAPNEDGLTYYVSPKGAHLVAITQRGSRYVVTRDGVPGPQVDAILNPGTASWIMNFSPDGERYGYSARVGQEWIAVVDGKEVFRRPVGSNDLIMRGGGPWVQFSPNSKHWFLFYRNTVAQQPTEDPSWYAWDGVPGPKGADHGIAVSPDGERYAYLVTNPANPQQTTLIVDGKPAGYVGFDPIFNADGTRLYTTREVRPAQGSPVTEVMVDGRVVARANNAAIHVPPVGSGALILVSRRDQQRGGDRWAILAGSAIVPNSESFQLGPVWFSADGKHYAVKSSVTPGGPVSLIVDGVRQREYTSVDSVRFTDDGKVAYVAQAGARWFVVTGDQESDVALGSMFVTLATGKGGRVGYAGSTTQGQVVVVDGKATRIEGRLVAVEEFRFSPDGTRYAYWVGSVGGGAGTVSVDGAPGVPSMSTDFAQFRPGIKDPVKFIWSPDSKYTLHYGSPGNQGFSGEYGMFFGDRYLPMGKTSRIVMPTFTPDGKHLFWAVEAGQRSMMEVWLDGKMVFEFDEQGRAPMAAPGGWEMGADGVLTFLVQTVEGFKRIRVTPGPGTGVEALLSKAKPVKG